MLIGTSKLDHVILSNSTFKLL